MRHVKGFVSLIAITLSLAAAAYSQTVLTGMDGSRVDVQGQRGKVVVLAIGASWLPLSGKQIDHTNALANKYKGQDVVVYFVSTDSANAKSKNFATEEAIKSFAATNKLIVPLLRDPDGVGTLKNLKVDQMPAFVVIDKAGAVAGTPFGGIDPKGDITRIARTIDKLLL
jgi:peroxiredoxin